MLLSPQFHLVWALAAISSNTEKAKLAKLKATELLLLLAMEPHLFFRPTLMALLDLAVLADWVVLEVLLLPPSLHLSHRHLSSTSIIIQTSVLLNSFLVLTTLLHLRHPFTNHLLHTIPLLRLTILHPGHRTAIQLPFTTKLHLARTIQLPSSRTATEATTLLRVTNASAFRPPSVHPTMLSAALPTTPLTLAPN